jgi:glycosyltransferase involved in cell wall biosynthesis
MRILLATGIYPPDAGGPATYTRALARALASSGVHQVQVVCYGDRDAADEKDGYPVERIGRNHVLLVRYAKFFFAVRRRARNADVVYLQGPVSEGLPGTLGAVAAARPTVLKVVGDYAWEVYAGNGGAELLDEFLTKPHAGKIRWIERVERWTASRARRLIVPSQYLKTVVMKWGVGSDRVTTIYNAVEPLPAGGMRDELRRTFGVADHRVMLTSVRAVAWKGVDFLIGLLSDLPQDVFLAVAGDGPQLEEWKKLVKQHDLTARVRFMGRMERAALADWYRAADLFVLASGYEGFPHVVAEAASLGLPSFVSDRGGNPETQAIFGADLIRVLPYQDRDAWLNSLKGTWPARTDAKQDALSFDQMISETVSTLNAV